MQQPSRGLPSMTPLERAMELTHPAFAILHQHGRFSGPPQKRVCEAILGDLRIVRRQGLSGVVLEIFSRDQQVMGLLLPDAGSAQLLGFDDPLPELLVFRCPHCGHVETLEHAP
jgi:hypothetical protein